MTLNHYMQLSEFSVGKIDRKYNTVARIENAVDFVFEGPEQNWHDASLRFLVGRKSKCLNSPQSAW